MFCWIASSGIDWSRRRTAWTICSAMSKQQLFNQMNSPPPPPASNCTWNQTWFVLNQLDSRLQWAWPIVCCPVSLFPMPPPPRMMYVCALSVLILLRFNILWIIGNNWLQLCCIFLRVAPLLMTIETILYNQWNISSMLQLVASFGCQDYLFGQIIECGD
jgi:hypothetical protein